MPYHVDYDTCLDPPEGDWCGDHQVYKPCYECRLEAAEAREEEEREGGEGYYSIGYRR